MTREDNTSGKKEMARIDIQLWSDWTIAETFYVESKFIMGEH